MSICMNFEILLTFKVEYCTNSYMNTLYEKTALRAVRKAFLYIYKRRSTNFKYKIFYIEHLFKIYITYYLFI